MNLSYKFKSFTSVSFLIAVLLSATSVTAQEAVKPGSSDTNKVVLSEDSSTKSDITAKDITRWTILGGTIPIVSLFGLKTWDWGDRHTPYSKREGFFGEGTSFGGSDKGGHFMAHYMVERAVYNIFDWTEDGQDQKWAYSIGTTMMVGLFIEVGDAYTSAYGFSYEDIVADYAGILVGAALEYSPLLKGFISFSIGYIPSAGYRDGYSKQSHLKWGLDVVNDYSGLQYMMNFKVAGFKNLGFDVPLALRLVSIDFGYYTKGYTRYDSGRYPDGKERDIFVGISINSAQLLSELWPDSRRNLAYTVSHTILDYYHPPYELIPVPTRYVNNLNK